MAKSSAQCDIESLEWANAIVREQREGQHAHHPTTVAKATKKILQHADKTHVDSKPSKKRLI